jgi:hypothetical protein
MKKEYVDVESIKQLEGKDAIRNEILALIENSVLKVIEVEE